MAYKQRGMDFGNGDPKKIPLSMREKRQGVYDDPDLRENLDARLMNLRQDLERATAPAVKARLKKQMAKLQAELDKM